MKYIILIIIGLFVGCSTNKSDQETIDLLFVDDNYAYKSTTIKDYTIKEEC
tara:strand:- start:116 stop:268 length:153 start_codon:yes stop_codon:yes gene_type:complete